MKDGTKDVLSIPNWLSRVRFHFQLVFKKRKLI